MNIYRIALYDSYTNAEQASTHFHTTEDGALNEGIARGFSNQSGDLRDSIEVHQVIIDKEAVINGAKEYDDRYENDPAFRAWIDSGCP